MKERNDHSFFSVIIPTYSRPAQLRRCLAALAQLHYPRDCFEVVVVDDGSEMSLETTVSPFHQPLNVTLLKQTNAGPAAARNTGAQSANGDFLAFTDDDCIPAPDWMAALARQFAKTPDRLLGGRTINTLPENLFATTSQLIVDVVYRHQNADPEQARFFASNNMAMPRKLFHDIGGFNPYFRTSEDRELCNRWRFHRYAMTYVEEAIVYHAHDLSFAGFCQQHWRYGRGAYHYHTIRAQRGSGTLRDDMQFHVNLQNWLVHPFTQVSFTKAFPLAGMLLLWQLINVAGFCAEACKSIRQKRDQ
jgi:GT2 family glycosyltransferase